jgi:hypothetical protein
MAVAQSIMYLVQIFVSAMRRVQFETNTIGIYEAYGVKERTGLLIIVICVFKAELIKMYKFSQASRSMFFVAVIVITSKSASGDNNLNLSCL